MNAYVVAAMEIAGPPGIIHPLLVANQYYASVDERLEELYYSYIVNTDDDDDDDALDYESADYEAMDYDALDYEAMDYDALDYDALDYDGEQDGLCTETWGAPGDLGGELATSCPYPYV